MRPSTLRPGWRVALEVLEEAVAVVGGADEYAIFGSATLRLRGIIDRDPGDIDVFVSRRVWGRILPFDGWQVLTPNAGDPPILAYRSLCDLHLFFDWRDDAVTIDVPAVLASADDVDGLRCCPVEEVLRHKQSAFASGTPNTAKHAPDIALIEAWLERRAA